MADGAVPDFIMPTLPAVTSGWGPSGEGGVFSDVPFSPFNRGERLGRVAELGNYIRYTNKRNFASRLPGGGHAEFQLDAQQDEDTFEAVEKTRVQKRQTFGKTQRRLPGKVRGWEDHNPEKQSKNERKAMTRPGDKRRQQMNRARRLMRAHRHQTRRDASIEISENWVSLGQSTLGELREARAPVPEAEDLCWAGALRRWEVDYDRVTPRTKKPIKRSPHKSLFVRAIDDPVIQHFAQEGEGNVLATESVLAQLMACSRSVYPWDIIVTIRSGLIVLDARDPMTYELQTVDETAADPPREEDDEEDINGRSLLGSEASAINSNFRRQVLSKTRLAKVNGEPVRPNPFVDADDEEEVAADAKDTAFRYRKFSLGNDDNGMPIELLARTSIHAYSGKGKSRELLTVSTLNEYARSKPKPRGRAGDARIKARASERWTKCLATQEGSLIAREMGCNAFRMGKVLAQSALAGSDSIRIGLVTRRAMASTAAHDVLKVTKFKPDRLSREMSLPQENLWGVLVTFIKMIRSYARDTAAAQDVDFDELSCKFIVLRDPNEDVVRIYDLSDPRAFESDEEEDSDDESDSDMDPAALRPFLMRPVARGTTLQCFVLRVKPTLGLGQTLFAAFAEDDGRFLMAAKKRSGKGTSNTLISMDGNPGDRRSRNIVGKLRANWAGSIYTLYDQGMSPEEAVTDASLRRELACVGFDYDRMGPGKMRAALPRVGDSGTMQTFRPRKPEDTLAGTAAASNMDRVQFLYNKRPRWDADVGGHVLNFNGRVTRSSVKNFQLGCTDCGDETVLQFGRVGNDRFTMDLQWPLAPLQAFAICLAAMDGKLADNKHLSSLTRRRAGSAAAGGGGGGGGASGGEDEGEGDDIGRWFQSWQPKEG